MSVVPAAADGDRNRAGGVNHTWLLEVIPLFGAHDATAGPPNRLTVGDERASRGGVHASLVRTRWLRFSPSRARCLPRELGAINGSHLAFEPSVARWSSRPRLSLPE